MYSHRKFPHFIYISQVMMTYYKKKQNLFTYFENEIVFPGKFFVEIDLVLALFNGFLIKIGFILPSFALFIIPTFSYNKLFEIRNSGFIGSNFPRTNLNLNIKLDIKYT